MDKAEEIASIILVSFLQCATIKLNVPPQLLSGEITMMKLSIREARQSLSSIEQILLLEGTVTITKRGKEIARVIPINRMISIPSHCNLREKTPRQIKGSELLIRADRDER